MKNAYPVASLLNVVTGQEERSDKYGEDYSDPVCGSMNAIDSEILLWVSCQMEDEIESCNYARAQTAWLNLEESLNL